MNVVEWYSSYTIQLFQVILKISKVEHVALRDFKEIEDCDDAMKKNVLNFSLNVALGKMDEAFR